MARARRLGPFGYVNLWVRRIRRLAVIASLIAAFYRWWRGRPGSSDGRGPGLGGGGGAGWSAPIGGPRSPSALSTSTAPERADPIDVTAPAAPAMTSPPAERTGPQTDAGTTDARWVDPLHDGGCPPTHPIKVNGKSHIFHVPGGRFYERTEALRCYTSADAAAIDGYRAAKA